MGFDLKSTLSALLLTLTFLLGGCFKYADYSLQSYTNATELKAKSLALLEKANGTYAPHKTEADQLLLDISVAYEFANGIENNNEAAKMWGIIRDPSEGLVGGFVHAWSTQQKSGFSSRFLENYKEEITFGFDRLICLETNKREPTSCSGTIEEES